jgi:hypothetical protein
VCETLLENNKNNVTEENNTLLEWHHFISYMIIVLNNFVRKQRLPIRIVTNFQKIHLYFSLKKDNRLRVQNKQ